MKLILAGYGKMGRETEAAAVKRDHVITARIDPAVKDADASSLTHAAAAKADAVIEFALPEGILDRVRSYAEWKLPAVIATTGWQQHLPEVEAIVRESGIGLVYGANFSVGANIFFDLVRRATRIANLFPEYDVLGYELHHKRKKDSPSGTALSTANIILDESATKTRLVTDRLNAAIRDGELHFTSVRGGYIPGIHTVLFDSETDTVELTHNVRSRSGLALGAVMAAEWIWKRTGCYKFDDFMREKLSGV
ncbi:MAG TPA: 4-hydroxy-tetrahydrodipicolinate reductase [Spirochaetia bacterium]|nr:4-hydroxy-tetrahydrodipicolinate reductase [Spirochaetia bacterium]